MAAYAARKDSKNIIDHVCRLGRHGFSGKCIARQVFGSRSSDTDRRKVYQMLASNDIRLADYRQGRTSQAKALLEQIRNGHDLIDLISRSSHKLVKRLRQAV